MITIEKYVITYDNTGAWLASVYIDNKTLIIVSDYGTYSYTWHNHGHDDLKNFILSCDNEYLATKAMPVEDRLEAEDFEHTKKRLLQQILSDRVTGDYSYVEARNLYNSLSECDNIHEYALAEHQIEHWTENIRNVLTAKARAMINVILPKIKYKMKGNE